VGWLKVNPEARIEVIQIDNIHECSLKLSWHVTVSKVSAHSAVPRLFRPEALYCSGALVARWKDGGLRLGDEAGASTLLLGLGGTRHCAIGIGGG
jgi:hypothetical protein